MKVLKLVSKNSYRRPLRTFLTILGIALAVMAFGLIRTFIVAWYAGARAAAPDRVITRHAVSIVFDLPLAYKDQLEKIEDKIEKEVEKATKRFGDSFDEKLFRETNPRVVENQKKYNDLKKRFISALEEENLTELRQIIVDNNIVCPISGTANWTEARQFNLMFNTQLGSVSEEANTIYLRPETAQGIFVNYLNVQKTGRMKIPFGIAQNSFSFFVTSFDIGVRLSFYINPSVFTFDLALLLQVINNSVYVGITESGLFFQGANINAFLSPFDNSHDDSSCR